MKRLNKNIGYPENIIIELIGASGPITQDQKDGYYHVLGMLSEFEQKILVDRYQNRLTYKNLAATHQVSEYRVEDTLRRAIRKLRRPDKVHFVQKGLFRMAKIQEERQAIHQLFDQKRDLETIIPLSSLENVGARTYTILKNLGFHTLNEVKAFVDANEDWYQKIEGLSASGMHQLEEAFLMYFKKMEENNEKRKG